MRTTIIKTTRQTRKELKGKLIYCPVCLKGGKINVLGAEIENGFVVKRFHNGTTIIYSKEFAVVCGECNELIYFKK